MPSASSPSEHASTIEAHRRGTEGLANFRQDGGTLAGGSPTASWSAAIARSLLTPSRTGAHRSSDCASTSARNPDGLVPFVGRRSRSKRCPTRSVPRIEHRLVVADAGANVVIAIVLLGAARSRFLRRRRSSRTSPECADGAGQPGPVGCDPMPTEIDEEDGLIYVGTLGAEVARGGAGLRPRPAGKVARSSRG